jgi:hypothetical protein
METKRTREKHNKQMDKNKTIGCMQPDTKFKMLERSRCAKEKEMAIEGIEPPVGLEPTAF